MSNTLSCSITLRVWSASLMRLTGRLSSTHFQLSVDGIKGCMCKYRQVLAKVPSLTNLPRLRQSLWTYYIVARNSLSVFFNYFKLYLRILLNLKCLLAHKLKMKQATAIYS